MIEHTIKAFDADLQDLGRMIAEMGGLAERQIGDALDALSRHDANLAGNIIVGELPQRQLRLVQAWAELHAEELTADWELAASAKPLNPIDPLR